MRAVGIVDAHEAGLAERGGTGCGRGAQAGHGILHRDAILHVFGRDAKLAARRKIRCGRRLLLDIVIAAHVTGERAGRCLRDQVFRQMTRRCGDKHRRHARLLQRQQHVFDAIDPRNAFEFLLRHIIDHALADFFDRQLAAVLHHAAGHVRNRRSGTLPSEVLIPVSAVVGCDFQLAFMPIRFGINQRAVHVPEHGFEHQLRNFLGAVLDTVVQLGHYVSSQSLRFVLR